MNNDTLLQTLALSGQMFGTDTRGGIVSVQDLLEEKLGRQVDFDEAVAYCFAMRKKARVAQIQKGIINYRKNHYANA